MVIIISHQSIRIKNTQLHYLINVFKLRHILSPILQDEQYKLHTKKNRVLKFEILSFFFSKKNLKIFLRSLP